MGDGRLCCRAWRIARRRGTAEAEPAIAHRQITLFRKDPHTRRGFSLDINCGYASGDGSPHETAYVQPCPSVYAKYMSAESSFAVSEARQQLAAIIDRARAEHAPVYLARRGRRVAAVIDADDLNEILQLAEDMTDIRAAEAARNEMRTTGATPIPWEQVKADLGLG